MIHGASSSGGASSRPKHGSYVPLIHQNTLKAVEQATPKLKWPARPERDDVSWCTKHYGWPGVIREKPKCSNLWGYRNSKEFQVTENFLSRTYIIYDMTTDLLVLIDLIRSEEPLWMVIVSASLMLLPALLKVLIFRTLSLKLLTGEPDRGGYGLSPCLANILYTSLSFFWFLVIDIYFWLFWPWTKPNSMVLGPLERISPVIETLFESTGQTLFQLWIYWTLHKRTEGEIHRESEEVQDLSKRLIFSFVPNLFSVTYRLYKQKVKAHAIGKGLTTYLPELVKAPLGISAPFLDIMGDKSTEYLDYTGVGPLNQKQQHQIFKALGNEGAVLPQIMFDDTNHLDLENMAPLMEGNQSLKRAWFGLRHTVEDVHAVLSALAYGNNSKNHCVVEIGLVELAGTDVFDWLEGVSPHLKVAKELVQDGALAGNVQKGRDSVEQLQLAAEQSGLLGGCLCAQQLWKLLQPFDELERCLQVETRKAFKDMSGMTSSQFKSAVEMMELSFNEAWSRAKKGGLDDALIRSCGANRADTTVRKYRKRLDAVEKVKQTAGDMCVQYTALAQESFNDSPGGYSRKGCQAEATESRDKLKAALSEACRWGVPNHILEDLKEIQQAQEILDEISKILDLIWDTVAQIESLDKIADPMEIGERAKRCHRQLSEGLHRAREKNINPCGEAGSRHRLESAKSTLSNYSRPSEIIAEMPGAFIGFPGDWL